MEIWLVLEIKKEQVGATKKWSKKYEDYVSAVNKAKDGDGLDWVASALPKPIPEDEKYETVPIYINVPRVKEISHSDPTKRYKDRLFNSAKPYNYNCVGLL